MEILSQLNLEQLGTSGIIIAILLWLYRDERTDRKKWQDRAFTTSETAQKELFEATQVFERVINAQRGGHNDSQA